MVRNNQYGPDAYRRLELVRTQFKNQAAEKKKQQAAERVQGILSFVTAYKKMILRTVVFSVLGLLLIAVIVTGVSGIFMK